MQTLALESAAATPGFSSQKENALSKTTPAPAPRRGAFKESASTKTTPAPPASRLCGKNKEKAAPPAALPAGPEASSENSGGAPVNLLQCHTCHELVPGDKIVFQGTGGKTKNCKNCHNAERCLRADYEKRFQKHLWSKMTPESKRQLIVKNKTNGKKSGMKRTLEVTRSTGVEDTLAMSRTRDFLNIREFSRECKKRWGMTAADAQALFKAKLRDPSIPQDTDELGWTTISWLAVSLGGA